MGWPQPWCRPKLAEALQVSLEELDAVCGRVAQTTTGDSPQPLPENVEEQGGLQGEGAPTAGVGFQRDPTTLEPAHHHTDDVRGVRMPRAGRGDHHHVGVVGLGEAGGTELLGLGQLAQRHLTGEGEELRPTRGAHAALVEHAVVHIPWGPGS